MILIFELLFERNPLMMQPFSVSLDTELKVMHIVLYV